MRKKKLKNIVSLSVDFENNFFNDNTYKITCAAVYRCNAAFNNEFGFIINAYNYYYDNQITILALFDKIAHYVKWLGRHGVNIYFHNLSYDSSFLIEYLLKNKYHQVAKLWQVRSYTKTFYTHILYKSKQVNSLVFFHDEIKFNIKCSYLMSRFSIAEEGELLGISKKGDKETETKIEAEYEKVYNINTPVPEFFLNYCLRDCEIAHKFRIKNYSEKYQTLANRAIDTVKNEYHKQTGLNFINDIQNQPHYADVWEYCDAAYRGGINILNKKFIGYPIQGVKCYDVNSFFPYCMTLALPHRIIDKEEYDNLPDNKKMTILMIRTHKITEKIPGYSVIFAVSDDVKYEVKETQYNDVHILYYYDFEWQELQNYYNFEYNIIDEMYFSASTYLKSTIEKLYQERQHYKKMLLKEPNNIEYKLHEENIKKILNSSYGKLAQDYFDETIIYYDHELTPEEIKIEQEKTLGRDFIFGGEYDKHGYLLKIHCSKTFGHGYAYTKRRIKYYRKDFGPVHIGGAITAYSRTIMLKTIRQIGPENVISGYTDSLKIIKDCFPKELIDSTKLGYWKDETKKIVAFTSLSKKAYHGLYADGTHFYKFSGVRTDITDWTLKEHEAEDFITIKKEHGKEIYDYINNHRHFIIKNGKKFKTYDADGCHIEYMDIHKNW